METGNAERSTDHLPQEIIEDILYRLPVKSLLRFKCVSPSWRSLISTKQFIKTHLQRSKKFESFADHRIISICKGRLKACSLSSLFTEPVTRAFFFNFYPLNISRDIVIVDSCNGLICVLVDARRFFLLNPSTREFKELPDFFTRTTCPKNVGSIRAYGFGFDESSGDYKVYAVGYMILVIGSSIARVYSLKADSWGRNLFFKNVYIFGSAKFVSGKFHWITDIKRNSKWEGVCFDLKSQTFGTVKQPSCMESYYKPTLAVLEGCLCVFSDYAPIIRFDIWIWNEYGVEDSWSKYVAISYPSISCEPLLPKAYNFVIPLFVLPSGEVLFTYGLDFLIYNKKDNCARQQRTVDFDHCVRATEVYTKSLVSLVPDD